eukprot:gene30051-35022_t
MLMTASGVLHRLHNTVFTVLNSSTSAPASISVVEPSLPIWDLRNIMGNERRKVLAGVSLVFSRLVPLEQDPKSHSLWRLAEQFGATCSTAASESTTHVIATARGTEKVWSVLKGPRPVPGDADSCPPSGSTGAPVAPGPGETLERPGARRPARHARGRRAPNPGAPRQQTADPGAQTGAPHSPPATRPRPPAGTARTRRVRSGRGRKARPPPGGHAQAREPAAPRKASQHPGVATPRGARPHQTGNERTASRHQPGETRQQARNPAAPPGRTHQKRITRGNASPPHPGEHRPGANTPTDKARKAIPHRPGAAQLECSCVMWRRANEDRFTVPA